MENKHFNSLGANYKHLMFVTIHDQFDISSLYRSLVYQARSQYSICYYWHTKLKFDMHYWLYKRSLVCQARPQYSIYDTHTQKTVFYMHYFVKSTFIESNGKIDGTRV